MRFRLPPKWEQVFEMEPYIDSFLYEYAGKYEQADVFVVNYITHATTQASLRSRDQEIQRLARVRRSQASVVMAACFLTFTISQCVSVAFLLTLISEPVRLVVLAISAVLGSFEILWAQVILRIFCYDLAQTWAGMRACRLACRVHLLLGITYVIFSLFLSSHVHLLIFEVCAQAWWLLMTISFPLVLNLYFAEN